MTIAQLLKHDFSKDNLYLYDSNGNIIYCEYTYGFWYKQEYDSKGNQIYYEDSSGLWYKREYNDNGNIIYCEDSKGYWYKYEYDSNGNEIYLENSTGYIVDNRPKASCDGKVVEIDGKKYKLSEI